jgi:RND family efflux transporter MFP subunit
MGQDTLDALRIGEATKTGAGSGGRRRKWPWILAVLVLAAVASRLLSPRSFAVQTAPAALVYPSRAVTELSASGYVVAQRKASLATKITSQLAWLDVEEGSRVKKGQVLARLEHTDLDAAKKQAAHDLQAARHQVAQAEAELRDATLNFKRMKTLSDRDVVAHSEYDTATARFDKARAALDQARAAVSAKAESLRQAEAQLSYTDLEAPFDAVVLTKNADVGDIISPLGASSTSKAAVVTIADMGSLAVEVDVAEASIHQVKLAGPCEITLDAIPDERFPGVVHMVVPTADRTKATVLVKVRFARLDPRVLPEMSAKVAFLSRPLTPEENTPRLAVPTAAVTSRDGRDVVFVDEGGRAVLTPVALGPPLGDMRPVLSGVAAGSRVVLSPPSAMQSGAVLTQPES